MLSNLNEYGSILPFKLRLIKFLKNEVLVENRILFNLKESAKKLVRNRMRIPMNKGGLKMPTADQVGLKKLPTSVRNKMGYMYGGGMMKKPRMSSMDYRKGGLLLISIDMMKKKNKKEKK